MAFQRRLRASVPVFTTALLAVSSAICAQPIAPEFQVNSIIASTQSSPRIAMQADGDFVAAWTSAHIPVRVTEHRRFTNPAVALGPDSLVSQSSQTLQPAIAVNESHYVVAWTRTDGPVDTVKAQVFDITGAFVGTPWTIANAGTPAVALSPTGQVVLAFEQPDSNDSLFPNILARTFSVTGGPPSPLIPVNTFTPGYQQAPSIAMDGVGNFVVTWQSDAQDGDGFGVYARRYDQFGNALGGEFPVNSYTTSNQDRPDVAMKANGEFAVVWESSGQDGSSDGVYLQYFDAAANKVGAELSVNQYSIDMQNDPACAFDGLGNLIISWTSEAQDGDVSGVFCRRFGLLGQALGDEFQVNVQTILYQFDSDVAAAADGSFVVVWQSFFGDGDLQGCFGRHYDANTLSSAPQPIASLGLAQNVPNPFNPSTTIRYTLTRSGPVDLTVFDARGRRVAALVTGTRPRGLNVATWDGRNDDGAAASSGVYFYRLRAGGATVTKKMILVK